MKPNAAQRLRFSKKHFQRCIVLGAAVLLSVASALVASPGGAHANFPINNPPTSTPVEHQPPPSPIVTLSNDSANRTVGPTTDALGVNVPQYIPAFTDPAVLPLREQASIGVYRYPGGSNADYYHWANNTADGNLTTDFMKYVGSSVWPFTSPEWPFTPYADPSLNFDKFMSTVNQQSGAQADITVNYETGTAQEAANWVNYANKNASTQIDPNYTGPTTGHSYGIKYWEIGNEDYGDGTYGTCNNTPSPNSLCATTTGANSLCTSAAVANGSCTNAYWEYTTPNKKGPTNYAQGVLDYSSAMKKVDSSIKIGAVLTMPGNFPDDQAPGFPTGQLPWNSTILNTPGMCTAIDFVAVHWYAQQPMTETDAALLGAPENGVFNGNPATGGSENTPGIPAIMSTLKQEIKNACGTTLSTHPIGIRVTESNSVNSNPGSQTVSVVNQMFLEDDIATFLENGAQSVEWWSLHNGFYQPANDIPGNPDINGTNTTNSNGYLTTNGPYTPVQHSKVNDSGSDLFDGNVPYGDFGLLSYYTGPTTPPPAPIAANATESYNGIYYPGSTGPAITEPAVDTPFPSYYGMEMMSKLIGSGGNVVDASLNATNDKVVTHAVLQSQPGGPSVLSILLINEDSNLNRLDSIVVILPSGDTIAQATSQRWTTGPNITIASNTMSTPVGSTSFLIASSHHESDLIQVTLN
jgi:hypothetical protein